MNVRRLFVSLLLLTAASTKVRAEIAATELLGDQANLMSGAVTASTRGGASIWYNPSRLSFGTGESFTFAVSGVGVAYRHYSAPSLVATSQGTSPGESSELLVLPRASTLVVRASDKLYWGVGLFTPARQDVAVQAGSSNNSAGATAFDAVALHVQRNSFHTMGSLSWKVNEHLLIGAGLAFVTYTYFRSLQVSSARYDPSTSMAMAAITQASQRDNYGYGMRATIGASFRLTEHWQLAASLAAPTWLFYTNTNNVTSQSGSLGAPGDLKFAGSAQQRRGGARERPEPGVGRFGLAYTRESVLLELDAEVSGGATSAAFNVDAPAVGNMRAGALIGLKEKMRLGLGVYTDLESRKKPLSELGDSSTRGVGATCGLNFVSSMPGSFGRTGDPRGTYSVTVATRYTHFKGDVLSLGVAEPGHVDGLSLAPTAATAHEFAAQVGLNAAW